MVYDGFFISRIQEIRFLDVSVLVIIKDSDANLGVPEVGCEVVATLTKLECNDFVHAAVLFFIKGALLHYYYLKCCK